MNSTELNHEMQSWAKRNKFGLGNSQNIFDRFVKGYCIAMVTEYCMIMLNSLYSSRFRSGQMGQSESRKQLGGLDLVQGARNLLDFLALVDEHSSLFFGPVLKNAIRRYEHLWLPLIAHQQRMHGRTDLATPLDIAWV